MAVLATRLAALTSPIGLIIVGAGVLATTVLAASNSFSELGDKSEAIDRTSTKFERLVELGKQAQSLDVSAPFIRNFESAGVKIGLQADQMQTALQKAAGFLRDNYEEVNKLRQKMTELEQLGYSGGQPFKAGVELDLAKNNEERIKAALSLMTELEDRGHKLAAINIGEAVFGADITEKLRTGEATVRQFVAALNEAAGKNLMNPEDAPRARELAEAIEKTKREIMAVLDIRSDFSKLGIMINEWYLTGLQAIKGVVDYLASSIQDLGKRLTESAFFQNAKWLLEQVGVKTNLGAPQPTTAIPVPEPTTIGSRTFPEMQGPKLPDPAQLHKQKEAAQSAASSYDLLIKRTEDRIDELKLEADTLGKTEDQVIKLKLAHDLERAALKDGTTVTAEMRKEWDALGDRLAKATDNVDTAREAQRRLQESTRALGDDFTRFFDDAILGSGKLSDAFGSMAKNFASGGLQALLTGQGPLAGMLGTSSTEKGGIGGIFGGQLPSFLKDAVQEGAEAGTQAGALGGLTDWFKGTSGKSVMQGAAGVAMIGGSFSIGQQSGSYGQAAISGAVSGGIGGAMLGAQLGSVGGPLGAVVGAALGIGFAIFGKSSADKARKEQEQKQAREQYDQQRGQIETFRSGLRGGATSGITATIEQARSQMKQASDLARKAGDTTAADAMAVEFETFVKRTRAAFERAFEGSLKDVQAGFGLEGPFTRAAAAAIQLGESLKSFVEDSKGMPNAAEAYPKAWKAAIDGALASLETPKDLSAVATEMERIRGTAAGLTGVLLDLGGSAEDVASIIAQKTDKAIRALKKNFETGLEAKTNDAKGLGYLNDASNLLAERKTLLADAASLGSDQTKVQAYFVSAAQKIVDESQLTGDAFAALVKAFPALKGAVHEFSEAVDEAAKKAAAASRTLGYGDRLFAATNDTSSLSGQLAAYDRQAQREREDEVKAGGEAIRDLERAQYAERLKIVTDFNAAATETERQRFEEAQSFLDGATKNIADFVVGLRTGSASPLSPEDRLAAAQSQFDAQLALAKSGDRDALSGITGNASALLDASKAYNASSPAYQADFQKVTDALSGLKDQVSAEQFIVDAVEAASKANTDAQAALLTGVAANSPASIAAALQTQFDQIDTNKSGRLSLAEFKTALGPLATLEQQKTAKDVFDALDTNGDGQLSKQEAIRAATVDTRTNTGATKSAVDSGNNTAGQMRGLLTDLKSLTTTLKAYNDNIRTHTSGTKANVATGNGVLNELKKSSSLQSATLTALNNQFTLQPTQNVIINGTSTQITNNMVTALNKIVLNTAMTVSSLKEGRPYLLADGGWVNGVGTSRSDSNPAMLSKGEFVVNAASARMNASMLEAINDNRPLPMAAVPVMVGGGGMDVGALVAELRALRDEVRVLRGERRADAKMVAGTVAQSGKYVGDRVEDVAEGQKKTADALRRQADRPATAGRKVA